MIVKSLVPPPKSPIRISSSRCEARLVGVGGGDRLVLEDDLVEAGEPDRRQQPIRGERVELGDRRGFEKCTGRPRMIRRGVGHDENPSWSLMCLAISAISFSSV